MAVDIPSPEQLPNPDKSLTQNLFDEFILESSREQSNWINEMLAYTLSLTLQTHDQRLAKAASLHRSMSNKTFMGKIMNRLHKNKNELELLKIGTKSFQRRTVQQIKDLRKGHSPEDLAMLVKESTQKAWELRAAPGWEEGRTEFMNRMVLASFIKFLVEKGYTEIGLVTGDMDGLKAFNTEDSKLGDCGLLTVFYGADSVFTKNGGMIFIPNQLGGDDIVGIFLGKSPEELKQIAESINQEITSEVPNIRKYAETDRIFDQPLKFAMTGESKQLDEKTIVEIEQKHGGRLIGPPRVTTTSTIISLKDPKSAVEQFFTIFSELHSTIDHIKAEATEADPNNERGNINSFLLGEAPPFPEQNLP